MFKTPKINLLFFIFIFLISAFKFAYAKDLFYLKGKVNINKASIEELKILPFIGTKKAEKIVSYRREHGRFIRPEELMKVEGIGRDLYSVLYQYTTIKDDSNLHYSKVSKFDFATVVIDSFEGPVKALENEKYFYYLSEKIQKAKDSIIVCMYIFKKTRSPKNYANKILSDLILASKRGVHITVILEKNSNPNNDLNSINDTTANKLKSEGINVRFDGDKTITHSKLIIIDDKYVFLGSHNLTHTALSKSNETSLMIESEELADYFTKYIKNIMLIH